MKSNFTSNIKMELLGGTDNFRLLEDLSYHIGSKDSIKIIKMEAGFITDGGSIPEWIKSFVRASSNRYIPAFALHDAVARTNYVSWKDGSKILDESLSVLGLGAYARTKVYYGLIWFGSATTDEMMIQNAYEHVHVAGI
jgi:hypothetical protein